MKNKNGRKNNIWFWVIGWLLCFPLPLTIIMLKKQSKQSVKLGVICTAWAVYLLMAVPSMSKKTAQNGVQEAYRNADETAAVDRSGRASGNADLSTVTELPSAAALTEEPIRTAMPESTPLPTPTTESTAIPTVEPTPMPTEEPTQAPTSAPVMERSMKFIATFVRADNYNIGDEWSYYYELDGNAVNNHGVCSIASGRKIKVYAKYTESDSKPDIGYCAAEHFVTEDDLTNGFSLQMQLNVSENGGRNSGKTAVFKITVKFEPVG